MKAALGALPADRAGVGSAALMAIRQVGGTPGIAVLGAVLNSVYRGQNYGPNGQLQGYQASETFIVTLNRLPAIGKVVTAAITAGANQVNGISFLTSDPNAGMQAAVSRAIAAARREARSEAAELGVTLGAVTLVKLDQNRPR